MFVSEVLVLISRLLIVSEELKLAPEVVLVSRVLALVGTVLTLISERLVLVSELIVLDTGCEIVVSDDVEVSENATGTLIDAFEDVLVSKDDELVGMTVSEVLTVGYSEADMVGSDVEVDVDVTEVEVVNSGITDTSDVVPELVVPPTAI